MPLAVIVSAPVKETGGERYKEPTPPPPDSSRCRRPPFARRMFQRLCDPMSARSAYAGANADAIAPSARAEAVSEAVEPPAPSVPPGPRPQPCRWRLLQCAGSAPATPRGTGGEYCSKSLLEPSSVSSITGPAVAALPQGVQSAPSYLISPRSTSEHCRSEDGGAGGEDCSTMPVDAELVVAQGKVSWWSWRRRTRRPASEPPRCNPTLTTGDVPLGAAGQVESTVSFCCLYEGEEAAAADSSSAESDCCRKRLSDPNALELANAVHEAVLSRTLCKKDAFVTSCQHIGEVVIMTCSALNCCHSHVVVAFPVEAVSAAAASSVSDNLAARVCVARRRVDENFQLLADCMQSFAVLKLLG